MREAYDHPIDANGMWTMGNGDDTAALDYSVRCEDCGAIHEHKPISAEGNTATISLKLNVDPKPVATIAIAFKNGEIEAIGSDLLVGLTVVDETRQEIGRFLGRPAPESTWWVRVKRLTALIPKGEHQASFEEGEATDE